MRSRGSICPRDSNRWRDAPLAATARPSAVRILSISASMPSRLAVNESPPVEMVDSMVAMVQIPNWRAARSFMISSDPPPIIMTLTSR